MQELDTAWRWVRRHWLTEMLAVMIIVAGVAVLRWDQVMSVSYRRVPIVSTQPIAGGDMAARAVIVDLGPRKRLVRTSDWMIRTRPGEQVCIAERKLLLRRWARVSLVLPGYCGHLPPAPREVGLSAS